MWPQKLRDLYEKYAGRPRASTPLDTSQPRQVGVGRTVRELVRQRKYVIDFIYKLKEEKEIKWKIFVINRHMKEPEYTSIILIFLFC